MMVYNMRYVEEREGSFLFQKNMLVLRKKEYTGVYAVVMNYSDQITNSIQELVGLASLNQSNLKMLKRS